MPHSKIWMPAFAGMTMLALLCTFARAEQTINVAIAKGVRQITLSGKAIAVYAGSDRAVLTNDRISIALKGDKLVIDKKSFEAPLRFLSQSPIVAEGKKVRGELDVLVDGGVKSATMTLVHPLPLETYVAGIVAGELPANWPLEAMKAQAIASRTYAVWQKFRRIDQSYHLDASVLDQVYGGLDKEHARAEQAAKETFGLVMTYDNKPTQAYFHSSCGGQTASALEVWGFDLPYLPGSKCGYCNKNGRSDWNLSVPKSEFEKAIADYKVKGVSGAKLGKKSASGRVKVIDFSFGRKTREMGVAELRQRLGYNRLRSTVLDKVAVRDKELIFSGHGHGHGVGMCQWGANGLAQAGILAPEILARYYPNSELRRMY